MRVWWRQCAAAIRDGYRLRIRFAYGEQFVWRNWTRVLFVCACVRLTSYFPHPNGGVQAIRQPVVAMRRLRSVTCHTLAHESQSHKVFDGAWSAPFRSFVWSHRVIARQKVVCACVRERLCVFLVLCSFVCGHRCALSMRWHAQTRNGDNCDDKTTTTSTIAFAQRHLYGRIIYIGCECCVLYVVVRTHCAHVDDGANGLSTARLEVYRHPAHMQNIPTQSARFEWRLPPHRRRVRSPLPLTAKIRAQIKRVHICHADTCQNKPIDADGRIRACNERGYVFAWAHAICRRGCY